jgi:hypothetical protein
VSQHGAGSLLGGVEAQFEDGLDAVFTAHAGRADAHVMKTALAANSPPRRRAQATLDATEAMILLGDDPRPRWATDYCPIGSVSTCNRIAPGRCL